MKETHHIQKVFSQQENPEMCLVLKLFIKQHSEFINVGI